MFINFIYARKYFKFLIFIFVLYGCDQSDNAHSKVIYKSSSAITIEPAGPRQFCPYIENIIKQEELWVTNDSKWKSYTPSSASKVVSFIGAQWAGVKVGKIICLYQTNEAVAFPLAIEQINSQSILEPSEFGWSALTKSHKFCKSASIADCPFNAELQKDNSNVYKGIEYNPSANQEE